MKKRMTSGFSQLVIDLGVLSIAIALAFVVRFDWIIPLQWFKVMVFLWPYIVAFEYLIITYYKIPKFANSYISLHEVKVIGVATTICASVLVLMRLVAGGLINSFGYTRYMLVPFGVILMNYVFSFIGITGVRVMQRLWLERKASLGLKCQEIENKKTLLIGAGSAGAMIVKEISTRPDLGIDVVGFLDDDSKKHNKIIHGASVLGSIEQIEDIAVKEDIEQIIISIANASGQVIRRISDKCEKLDIPTKIVPGVYELVGGQVNLSRIRNVEISDLLGREAVQLKKDSIAEDIRGKVILVTGAGGSIGSEMCRQVCVFGPKKVILVEQAENNLFHIHRELRSTYENVEVEPCIADITDKVRIEKIYSKYKPSLVYHAAAHKHVPMMEWNPGEAIKNNILGTKNLADLADKYEVGSFVMISTDKAINPTSVMGASKRIAEIYIQALSQRSDTKFVTVRFGNVLGSSGSVVPIFKEQIKNGGPVTVTHPDMTRYFMTIPEASQLVLQAATMGEGGEIFILDMGQPVKIVDLAKDLIRLSGFVPDKDIMIEFSGVRPGEKLFEELAVKEESVEKTWHPKIFIGKFRENPWDTVTQYISAMAELIDVDDVQEIYSQIKEIVPEYKQGLS